MLEALPSLSPTLPGVLLNYAPWQFPIYEYELRNGKQ